MRNIQARPVRDLRNNFAEIETLLEEHDPVIITKNGRGTAVLLNLEDFAEIEAYQHIKYVEDKLREAELEADSDDAEWEDYRAAIDRLKAKYCGL
jgi:prevent-host-death family protein